MIILSGGGILAAGAVQWCDGAWWCGVWWVIPLRSLAELVESKRNKDKEGQLKLMGIRPRHFYNNNSIALLFYYHYCCYCNHIFPRYSLPFHLLLQWLVGQARGNFACVCKIDETTSKYFLLPIFYTEKLIKTTEWDFIILINFIWQIFSSWGKQIMW